VKFLLVQNQIVKFYAQKN